MRCPDCKSNNLRVLVKVWAEYEPKSESLHVPTTSIPCRTITWDKKVECVSCGCETKMAIARETV